MIYHLICSCLPFLWRKVQHNTRSSVTLAASVYFNSVTWWNVRSMWKVLILEYVAVCTQLQRILHWSIDNPHKYLNIFGFLMRLESLNCSSWSLFTTVFSSSFCFLAFCWVCSMFRNLIFKLRFSVLSFLTMSWALVSCSVNSCLSSSEAPRGVPNELRTVV